MAVILEAYLLGCGQAMINSFIQQVQAVEALQEVAITIKQIYPDKTDLPPTGATFELDYNWTFFRSQAEKRTKRKSMQQGYCVLTHSL